MRQHLVVVGHRFLVERRAHRARDLDGRQLPEPAEQPLGRAAHEHDLVLSFEPHQRARELGELVRLLADGHHRQLALTTGAIRRARLRERAGEAARLRRRAHGRTELHQALVELARRAPCGQGSHQLGRLRPRRLLPGGRLDVVLDREHAGEHARDVSVDQRRALAVRDRGDRTGGVRPDAGHVAQPGRGRRQRLADALRAAVEVPRARVVAEAGPRGEHVVERRRRERTHRRELGHPALPVRDHGGDARLLEHHLRHPDRVRVARAPPRQVALHAAVVLDDGARELRRVHGAVVSVARIGRTSHATPPSSSRTTTASSPACASPSTTRRNEVATSS